MVCYHFQVPSFILLTVSLKCDLLLLLHLLSPLCRVFTIMYLKQTMFLGYIVLQLFFIFSFRISVMRSLYFKIFSASFLIIFLSHYYYYYYYDWSNVVVCTLLVVWLLLLRCTSQVMILRESSGLYNSSTNWRSLLCHRTPTQSDTLRSSYESAVKRKHQQNVSSVLGTNKW